MPYIARSDSNELVVIRDSEIAEQAPHFLAIGYEIYRVYPQGQDFLLRKQQVQPGSEVVETKILSLALEDST